MLKFWKNPNQANKPELARSKRLGRRIYYE